LLVPLNLSRWQWPENIERMKVVIKSTLSGKGKILLIKEMDHQNFCDVPFFASPFVLRKSKIIGTMDRYFRIEL
jgi:hypothetical protein